MASVKTSGSHTATLASPYTLATVTDAGTYQLVVDVANLAAGEELTLKVYGKARSSGTERLEDEITLLGENKVFPLVRSLAYPSPHHIKFTLEQNGGTGRAYPWAVYEL